MKLGTGRRLFSKTSLWQTTSFLHLGWKKKPHLLAWLFQTQNGFLSAEGGSSCYTIRFGGGGKIKKCFGFKPTVDTQNQRFFTHGFAVQFQLCFPGLQLVQFYAFLFITSRFGHQCGEPCIGGIELTLNVSHFVCIFWVVFCRIFSTHIGRVNPCLIGAFIPLYCLDQFVHQVKIGDWKPVNFQFSINELGIYLPTMIL